MAEVVVDIRTRALDRAFDYRVPAEWAGRVQIGHRVYVSFAKRYIQGFVTGLRTETEASVAGLKPILALLDESPLLDEELLALCDWMRERYVCTRADALGVIVPSAFRVDPVRRYAAVGDEPPQDTGLGRRIWKALRASARSFAQVVAQFGPDAALQLERLLHAGYVREVMAARDRTAELTAAWLVAERSPSELAEAAQARARRAPRQAQLLGALAECGRLSLRDAGLRPSDPAVQAIVHAGWARIERERIDRMPEAAVTLAQEAPVTLTPAQARALAGIREALAAGTGQTVVLFGVTGSGKTEVYLQAIAHCLARGGGAIVLVPEIALTPQMVARFVQRFGEQVAVLHSGLSAGEKRDQWLRARRGEARIVVGARSAVFAPVADLRLVIVDEEHEPSYKQEESPRYDAREVAQWRTSYHGGAVILGSATPSLTAMHHVETGQARLATLPTRVNGGPLPPVTVIDMREELRQGNRSIFSRALAEGLERTVGAGQQAILFLNRRGYAAFLLCRNCGAVVQCPHCDISLTMHRNRDGDWLSCHYCGYAVAAPARCPDCGEDAMRPFGIGTQQVEELLRERWPGFRVLRLDVDTARRKGAHREVLQRFLDGEADVLLGTQMIAKGLDIPNVTFVGVITADTMLAVPDFRAAERTFNLLTQVAGRAGRADLPGSTVIQTYRPEHYAIQAAARHDYAAFYRRERELRRQFGYPPFRELTVFVASHSDETVARGAAARFERELRRSLPAAVCDVLPAVPAAVRRVQNQYRYQVVIKYRHWPDVRGPVADAFRMVSERMRRLGGECTLDVNAGRI